MKKTELIFRFQNPNTIETTANFFLQSMIQANEKRLEEAILHTIRKQKNGEENDDQCRRVLPCVHG